MGALARLVAFYLPQFHPIPENDKWWGKGFTEWTNVAKAKPLFKGHYQPHLPADLGFYDLRVPEVREAQAEMARNAGVEAFCYYHYWFAGRRLLERPVREVVMSGKPDFPYCLCWANQTWSGVWYGAPNRILMEQTYPGTEDNRKHFFAVRDAFLDQRYLQVDGRPVFVIFRPLDFPNVSSFIKEWRDLAVENGLPGIYFIAHLFSKEASWDYAARGFDGSVVVGVLNAFSASLRDMFPGGNGDNRAFKREFLLQWAQRRLRRSRGLFDEVRPYRLSLPYLRKGWSEKPTIYPTVIPNWDNTPRSSVRGSVLHESSPELFRVHLREALAQVQSRPDDKRLVFIKSWNEWAEGNYLEPDQRFGHGYLDVVREEVLGSVKVNSQEVVSENADISEPFSLVRL